MRIFANANYNFIKWRWHALIGSMIIIWAGVGSIYFKGIPLSIDFTGGTVVIVDFQKPTDEAQVRSALNVISTDTVVQRYGNVRLGADHEFMIRLPITATGAEKGRELEAGADRIVQALETAHLDPVLPLAGKDVVGPIMGKDLQSKGIWATVAALGGILLYVMFRFRFTFAVGAIVAAFHDILITLVFLAWFHYDLSLNVIAAIADDHRATRSTAPIVVFDRVRENQKLARREPLDQIVNKSVNQTLGRTIITSGATFLAVFALFLFGGEVLRGFAFTMLIGVITGTYSTVFIAAAIAIILSRSDAVKAVAPGSAKKKN